MNLALARLANQGIASAHFAAPGDVVAWLGAMQSQDYAGTLWAIGLRMQAATAQSIEQAIVDRTIVRTWPMRGTLHFVAAQDVRWLLALLTPRVIAQSAGRYRQLGLDEATFGRSKTLFANGLVGGKQLTRDQMYQLLEQGKIATEGQRGYHLLARSAQDGLICFGARSGKQQTFTLLDEWLPPAKPLLRDEALAALTRRYFFSHGPATLLDFMRWAGLTSADAKIGLAAVGKELVQETLAEQIYWLSPDSAHLNQRTPAIQLLPGFDEYLLGYSDRSAVLDAAHADKICPGGNGVFNPTIVLGGKVVGTWKRVVKKDRVVITLTPFQPLSAIETIGLADGLADAARHYGDFLGLPAVIA